jgi:hypothetical protein
MLIARVSSRHPLRLTCKPRQSLGSKAYALVRLRALAHLGEMADRGDFDGYLGDKSAYRK